MAVNDEGIEIEVREVQERKAAYPMPVTVVAIKTMVMVKHPLIAKSRMNVTSLGIVMIV